MTILILCATAKTSIRVASLLQPDFPVLLASRSGRSMLDSPGVAFDWDLPEQWDDIFKHERARWSPITAVYMVMRGQTVDYAATGIPFINLCISKGVKRFVQLSGSALSQSGEFFDHVKMCCDQKEIQWTTLRPSWFMENFSEEEYFPTIQQWNQFYTATGTGKIPMVSCDDIARVACCTLTKPTEQSYATYLVCGPENISYDDCAMILSEVVGRKIRHVNVDPEKLLEILTKDQPISMPREYAQLLVDLDVRVAEGKEEYNVDTVEMLTGKKPISFRDFCETHKELWRHEPEIYVG